MESSRLFVAVPVSPLFLQQAAALPRGDLAGARWVHPDDLHITLRFIGDVPAAQIDFIDDFLKRVRVKPFNIVVRGLDVFHQHKENILYAAIESHRAITHLSAEVTDKLNEAGFIFPTRPYVPHITLARLKTTNDTARYIGRHHHKIYCSWKVESFGLYQSGESESGTARYRLLKQFKLLTC